MALGGMEQWREGKWHEVNTKMSLERSYQCATPITRYFKIILFFPCFLNLSTGGLDLYVSRFLEKFKGILI